MDRPFLLLVYGLSATGKTTLAKELSNDLRVPVIGRDDIKELLFDELGWSDREWSRKLGKASYILMYRMLEDFLRKGVSLIVESNFNPKFARDTLLGIRDELDVEIIEINCVCEGETLFERFKQRSLSGERHPGHVDQSHFNEYKKDLIEGERESLDLGGKMIKVDTTVFSKIPYDEILEDLKLYLGK